MQGPLFVCDIFHVLDDYIILSVTQLHCADENQEGLQVN